MLAMNKSTLIWGVVAVLIALGVWHYQYRHAVAPAVPAAPKSVDYTDAKYGISFTYPDSYVLSTEDEKNASPWALHYILLMHKADLPPPVNSDGPPTISIAFFNNNPAHKSLAQWFKSDPMHSNYDESNGTYASTTVAGQEAITYKWSGLYEGITTAFLYKDTIVSVSVGYLNAADEIVTTYNKLLASLRLP